MKKLTEINIKNNKSLIQLNDNIFSIGSCFSNEIFSYFQNNGIYILSNPFGTVYNIFSIYKIFERCLNKINYCENDLVKHDNRYFSLEHSTYFESENKNKIIKIINEKLNEVQCYMKNCGWYIITLGTSVIYRYIDKNEIVSNCHKIPHNKFKKEIFSVNQTVAILEKIIKMIYDENNKAKIIFTVSPVRHTPIDLIENSYSKSILRSAIGSIVNNKNVYYFPSYEIVLDELRNYEFYKKDMMHLKTKSVNYVMRKFNASFFHNNLKEFINSYSKYKKITSHKVKNKNSLKYYDMLIKCLKNLNDLYEKKVSKIIIKEKFKICKKLLYNFSTKKELLTIFQNTYKENSKLYKLFQLAFDIKNNPELVFDDNNFINMDDAVYVKKFKEKILIEYYKNNKKYEKIAKILKI